MPHSIDRADDWRADETVITRLRADPGTEVVVVRAARALAIGAADEKPAGLRLCTVAEVEAAVSAGGEDSEALPGAGERVVWALLGRRGSQGVLLGAVAAEVEFGDASWLGIRQLAPLLDEPESRLLVTAVALAGWLRDAAHCPRCGARTQLGHAGWARHCASCDVMHFPRTDPAVIVAIESADGERLLLGANALWRGEMFSCFAGFVEAGESLEDAVHREIAEEAGVRLREVRYQGSQPWPMPRSLMLGFRATAIDEDAARGDGEEILEARWFTRAQLRAALAGDGPVQVAGPASLAHRLIRDWCAERP